MGCAPPDSSSETQVIQASFDGIGVTPLLRNFQSFNAVTIARSATVVVAVAAIVAAAESDVWGI
jgi:hypothetical protein